MKKYLFCYEAHPLKPAMTHSVGFRYKSLSKLTEESIEEVAVEIADQLREQNPNSTYRPRGESVIWRSIVPLEADPKT